MGRYISIFFLALLLGVVLFFTIALSLGHLVVEIDLFIGMILIVFGSFIITQLFFIIDLLQKNSPR
ncbi:hypothetical protein ACOI1C_05795 [Bacillus sp. DJP31]|uniref:hypothetical protein n=1 Tax=Bacillus sp. DJP31 TaxID=3409789 RepID=UPI003BB6C7C0